MAWSSVFPDSTLSSMTRTTSDHVLILLHASSDIPKPSIFRLNNCLLSNHSFLQQIATTWSSVGPRHSHLGSTGMLCLKLKWSRNLAKKWAVNAKTPKRLATNCTTTIDLLDKLEEFRPLSTLELSLRMAVKVALHRYNKSLADYWRQRAKLRECTVGDENSAYMHACASVRFRKNQIKTLHVDGQDISSHLGKERVLHSYFTDLLGTSAPSLFTFDLLNLFRDSQLTHSQALSLSRPFSLDELRAAILAMNSNASPGPDGFGPAFFKANWDLVKSDLLALMEDFHKGTAQLNRINKAFIVLLPKKRKKSAIVLKLDFKKAFDSVSWTALAVIMLAKGFPEIWCNWVDSLNRSSQSAVVLNGKPGPWINYKQGLRQGDSLSPYLFIIVADVLQRLIYQASNDGRLAHPINQELPCPVLQYADDTLIILPAEAAQLQSLKDILLQFSQATGLHINFHKSTFAPIHVPPELAKDLADIFGCPVASFPQSYLGLPLSTHKLHITDFFFIIDKIDRRLAGWRGILLSIAGRAILVRAVL
nr:uncharacterized protein LOC120974274 [Aegilops tauschii subsp. strangulata]